MNSDSVSVTKPSANTVAVCATVTVAPSANACRADPFDPARYAATIVLPCPGVSACSAPHPIASAIASSTKPAVSLRFGSTRRLETARSVAARVHGRHVARRC